jgi:hypothetical protein
MENHENVESNAAFDSTGESRKASNANLPIIGRVIADSRSFDGDVFRPINTSYGIFHPTVTLGFGKLDAYLPPLEYGEYFQVREEFDKSEGRRGTGAAGNFLVYADAYAAAAGLGVQGSRAEVVIVSPAGFQEVTALAADGTKVTVATIPQFQTVRIASRLVFSKHYTSK